MTPEARAFAESLGQSLRASGLVSVEPVTVVVPGPPAPKPRQTRRDKWMLRPPVVRYRRWADLVRQAATGTPAATAYRMVFYLKMPLGWSAKKRARMAGTPHYSRPDGDNLAKATLDALLPESDSGVAELHICKRWEDEKGPRTEITPLMEGEAA